MKINLIEYGSFELPGLMPRDVWVWLPPQYHQRGDRHFPVLYMHDGQNLFFPEASYDNAAWGIAEAISKQSAFGFIQPAIVVAIGNTLNRTGDYLPLRPFEYADNGRTLDTVKAELALDYQQAALTADTYLSLIVEKIKPKIDQDFHTLPDKEATLVMGASMGGLISLYALVEYPHIFGKAGCLSTHWPLMRDAMVPYLQAHLPEAGEHQLYFDHGTRGYDATYSPYQQSVDEIMRVKGYIFGKDWLTHIAPGADHHERDFKKRLHLPLRFLLG